MYVQMDKVDIVLKAGGRRKTLEKGEVLYREEETAYHLYMVESGKIKIINIDEEGREFIQDFVTNNMSFGAVALFNDGRYPATAIAVEKSEVIALEKSLYLELLKTNFDFHFTLTSSLAMRLRMQVNKLKSLGINNARERILYLFNRLKKDAQKEETKEFLVDLTRKEIAALTGLRTETVIRSIKKMETEEILKIKGQKIFYQNS